MIGSKGPKETFGYRRWLTFLYSSYAGRVLRFFIARKWFNHLVGLYQDSKLSCRAIEPFIQHHNITMDDFIVPAGGYTSFNQFFIRALKPGARVIDAEQHSVIAPADSRVLVFPRLHQRTSFTIKGTGCTLEGLFMGIVIKKIQREERPHCKILPEEVRQAPSVLHSQPRNVGLAPLPTFEDLRSRKQQASPKGN